MAKGLNKHTPDSDELLKRLNSNDSSGLDDFEKEALEGFDSLDNAELAKNLNDSLNKKIEEKYFQQKSNKKRPLYLSLAAGLVLVVGLSIFFMNIMGDKKEMAMENAPSPETITNEVTKPTDLVPAELEEAPKTEGKSSAGGNVPVTTVDALAKTEEKFVSTKDVPTDTRAKEQPDNDDGLTSRMVLKEKKTETAKEPYKVADAESGDELKNIESDKSKGPPAGNSAPASPMAVEDQKAKPVQNTKVQEEEANETVALSKTTSNNNAARHDAKSGKDANKQSSQKKERRKDKSGEALGNEDAVVAMDATTVKGQPVNSATLSQNTIGGVATGTKRDESGYVHNVEYGNHAYYKPQDYIKVEINKSEMLKTNVKAFKAELTINEKGTVTAVKFLTTFDNCVGCKKELEKILLNMPGWKPKSKSAVETVSYIDQ